MTIDYQHVVLCGVVAADPRVFTARDGSPTTTFPLIVPRSTDDSGEPLIEEIPVAIRGPHATTAKESLGKGLLVAVEGHFEPLPPSPPGRPALQLILHRWAS